MIFCLNIQDYNDSDFKIIELEKDGVVTTTVLPVAYNPHSSYRRGIYSINLSQSPNKFAWIYYNQQSHSLRCSRHETRRWCIHKVRMSKLLKSHGIDLKLDRQISEAMQQRDIWNPMEGIQDEVEQYNPLIKKIPVPKYMRVQQEMKEENLADDFMYQQRQRNERYWDYRKPSSVRKQLLLSIVNIIFPCFYYVFMHEPQRKTSKPHFSERRCLDCDRDYAEIIESLKRKKENEKKEQDEDKQDEEDEEDQEDDKKKNYQITKVNDCEYKIWNPQIATVYLATHHETVTVWESKCPLCKKWNQYDGGIQDHLFKANDKTYIEHNIADFYRLLRYGAGSVSFKALHDTFSAIYHTNNCDFISLSLFSKFLKAFEQNLLTEKRLQCRTCKEEGVYPKIVTSDGTELNTKAMYVQNCIPPSKTWVGHDEDTIKMRKMINKTRARYIDSQRLRKRLQEYFRTSKIAILKTDTEPKEKEKFTVKEINQLYQDLETKLGNNYLTEFVKWLTEHQNLPVMTKSAYTDQLWWLVSHWGRYISAHNCALYQLSRNRLNDKILAWEWDENAKTPRRSQWKEYEDMFINFGMEWLAVMIRLLYKHHDAPESPISFPQCLHNLIKDIAKYSKQCLQTYCDQRDSQQPIPTGGDNVDAVYSKGGLSGVNYGAYSENGTITAMRATYDIQSEVDKRKKYFESKQKKKQLLDLLNANKPSYGDSDPDDEEQQELMEENEDNDDVDMDEEENKDGDNEETEESEDEDMDEEENKDGVEVEEEMTKECSKYFNTYDKMSGGILVMSCVKHEQAMGFNIIQYSESTDDHFSLLCALYPDDKHPDHYIMDNACNLYPYCVTREPRKFQDMCIHTDEFHGLAGHKCGPVANVKLGKDVVPALKDINDSHIEQLNRILKRLKISALWMNCRTLHDHVTMILDMHNRRQLRKAQKMTLYY